MSAPQNPCKQKENGEKYLNCWEKKTTHQSITLCSAKLSFRSEREIKINSDKQKLGEFVASWLFLQEMLK